MDSNNRTVNQPDLKQRTLIYAVVALATLWTAPIARGQVRGKLPDRASYRSPVLEPIDVEPLGQPELATAPLAAAELPQPPRDQNSTVENSSVEQTAAWTADMAMHDQSVIWDDSPLAHASTCDGCSACDGCSECDGGGIGCDSIGACRSNSWSNSSLSLNPRRWFGSVELLLMFRDGQRLPPLVTTDRDVNPGTDADTAGELGRAGTEILFGNERVFNDLRAGGRVTLGTWIDPNCCRSLVMRGWFGGAETAKYSTDQTSTPVIVRPFTNVSDNQTPAQDTQIVAFPTRATGSIAVRATSDVFGADVSVRQPWYRRFGGTIDVLYGYQYMQLNEDLSIASSSISQDASSNTPVGSLFAVEDAFEARNEFHGGQIGIASRYREGCWSFHSLIKTGFGQLARSATLRGETLTSVDGNNATVPTGLLVRSTNARSDTDHTFGWVPELDLTWGWHQYPRFDVTIGYNFVAMTDALQVSGLIDPDLAVNLSEPPTGQQRPAAVARHETFFVHGIHFGLQYVY
jgi:hypothetical protein